MVKFCSGGGNIYPYNGLMFTFITTDSMKVTPEEITRYRSQLADHPKAISDLEVVERCEGNLEQAARVLTRRAGVKEVRAGENWQLALQKAREVVCDDKFTEGLLPGLIGGLIGALATSTIPVLVAVATPVSIYIAQVGIDSFCKSQKSASGEKSS
ncbi:MAG: hypothetical protein AB4426_08660 [Xenococcaceae cyanobacterium]